MEGSTLIRGPGLRPPSLRLAARMSGLFKGYLWRGLCVLPVCPTPDLRLAWAQHLHTRSASGIALRPAPRALSP